uniref:NADH dehydrogenase subunit 3 n=1 Tax=Gloiopeltis furcata TaxID=42017 RepID=A0A5A4SG92_9FLOR|nr:NADH dehydrogenase subunit 3 [Gloiopeltis furcata]BBK20783.1 NADH dehydrogenase subunit 3 [Gloiopeltis furcata]
MWVQSIRRCQSYFRHKILLSSNSFPYFRLRSKLSFPMVVGTWGHILIWFLKYGYFPRYLNHRLRLWVVQRGLRMRIKLIDF